MKEFNFTDIMGYFTQFGFDFQASRIIVIAIFIFIVLIYLLTNMKDHQIVTDNIIESTPVELESVTTSTTEPRLTPKSEVVKSIPTHIPQDSVLRRHFLAHIRYMLETVNFPRPTEMVLRRHYDHLIASKLEACLEDEAQLKELISRYDEHRRDAMISGRCHRQSRPSI